MIHVKHPDSTHSSTPVEPSAEFSSAAAMVGRESRVIPTCPSRQAAGRTTQADRKGIPALLEHL
jgi:hypothetical protein